MQLNLVENGIFPIIYDKNGELINQPDSTGFKTPGTIQGEGKLLGSPCLFIRTSSCNIRCSWIGSDGKGSPCDTPYSSHKPEKNRVDIDDIVSTVIHNTRAYNINQVVISGGEPTMQTIQLIALLKQLKEEGYHTTIETNATIYTDDIAKYTDLISMSPKLKSSTPWEANLVDTDIQFNQRWAEKHETLRKNIPVIQQYINSGKDFQLKFVISSLNDVTEIENDFLSQLTNWKPSDVCLMPEGVTVEDLQTKSLWVTEEAVKRGFRFSPRLHVLLWQKNRYV